MQAHAFISPNFLQKSVSSKVILSESSQNQLIEDPAVTETSTTAATTAVGGKNNNQNRNKNDIPVKEGSPSFFEALFGIAINGSPWEYMIQMRKQGYNGVVPVNLGPVGNYNFLLNPQVVRAATVEEASNLSRRFSVQLFETLELDKGLVYEQGDRHKLHKKTCIPSFEQKRSMESFVTATREELNDLAQIRFFTVEKKSIDLYAEMRQSALNVVLDVSFGLGKEGATNFQKSELLSKTIAEYLERIVALANEIPPLWQISPRLSQNYVRVTDVVLPRLRSLVAEVIESRRLETEAPMDDYEKPCLDCIDRKSVV